MNNWISVKDRLPESLPQKVDVYKGWGLMSVRITDCWFDGKVFCNSDGKGGWNRIDNVTHWMPIPKPPTK